MLSVGNIPHSNILRRLEEVSWDFEGDKSRSAWSAVHFHPARFISQVPSLLIQRLTREGDTVLDPFCGSGTTLVEAKRLNRNSIGIDINPVSVLVSRAKTLPISRARATVALTDLTLALVEPGSARLVNAPATVQMEKWYSPNVASDLLKLFTNIENTTDQEEKTLKTFCFSSILVRACRETRHWGYICDNTQPKDHPSRDVMALLDASVSEILRAFGSQDETKAGRCQVFEADARKLGTVVENDSVDLVVTSPPYEGVVDYVKAQRLTMEWLGLDIASYRTSETGARSKRHRTLALTQFKDEIAQVFAGIHQALKPGAPCVAIFGVSPKRGFSFSDMEDVFDRAGFIFEADFDRDVSIKRRFKPSVLHEKLFILSKPQR